MKRSELEKQFEYMNNIDKEYEELKEIRRELKTPGYRNDGLVITIVIVSLVFVMFFMGYVIGYDIGHTNAIQEILKLLSHLG